MPTIETEYWTVDPDGNGYCSVYSLEDALRGHFQDMQAKEPLGPIVDIKIVTVTKTISTDVVHFWEDRYPNKKKKD